MLIVATPLSRRKNFIAVSSDLTLCGLAWLGAGCQFGALRLAVCSSAPAPVHDKLQRVIRVAEEGQGRRRVVDEYQVSGRDRKDQVEDRQAPS